MAKEYIEREAALVEVKTARNQASLGKIAATKLEKFLTKLPASDVAPVLHGRWIENDGYQICSNCGEEHCWDEYRASYCDCCGAKMDG